MSMGLDIQTAAALSPGHVGGYLRANGWSDQGPYGAYGRLFGKPSEPQTHEVVLPIRASIDDFGRRMIELVRDLAKAEGRLPDAVLSDLALTPFDVVRIRSKDADDYGSIPLAEGVRLHEEARNLLIAAARAAIADAPRRAWKGRRPECINEYLSRVRLGQTEKSSFSLTILSPYSFDPADQGSLFGEEAFGRRVTLQFGQALTAVETALAGAVSEGSAAFERAVAAGVSAELCQSLAGLSDNDAGVEVSVSWSPARPAGEPARLPLNRQDAALLREAARTFAREEPEPDAVIEGFVTQISEDPRTFDGSATLGIPVEGRRLRIARITGFQAKDRELLIAAFRDRRPVRVEGELMVEGPRLKLGRIRELVVLGGAD